MFSTGTVYGTNDSNEECHVTLEDLYGAATSPDEPKDADDEIFDSGNYSEAAIISI